MIVGSASQGRARVCAVGSPLRSSTFSSRIMSGKAHHGDCEGGDAQFHELCKMAGVAVVIHPPEDPKLRAFCKGAERTEPERPYLVRNHIIVDCCEMLLAAPKELEEPPARRGQGTWSTVRYARRAGRDLRIV